MALTAGTRLGPYEILSQSAKAAWTPHAGSRENLLTRNHRRFTNREGS